MVSKEASGVDEMIGRIRGRRPVSINTGCSPSAETGDSKRNFSKSTEVGQKVGWFLTGV